ncbi:hypothetical protein FVEG_06604 [Fusarium verticillioides 7600]|uniref:Uncharacterized protein n=1 Tax=Gibberella moniliformis (strain M3125 / FGSC 7600) TaxID=334819 RepID=W7M4R2_GIBM7|nr:hypothetical protein FVEG_06604 [Fusarium verticillioides 7600]EWG45976.1 hypothetical protein FVEG_06604 [Fusarium verticillioides 7600]
MAINRGWDTAQWDLGRTMLTTTLLWLEATICGPDLRSKCLADRIWCVASGRHSRGSLFVARHRCLPELELLQNRVSFEWDLQLQDVKRQVDTVYDLLPSATPNLLFRCPGREILELGAGDKALMMSPHISVLLSQYRLASFNNSHVPAFVYDAPWGRFLAALEDSLAFIAGLYPQYSN